jgi:arylsulfatase A-like enzyme
MNILFITADQWRGDCLSAVGHPHVKTPHLDMLAADGVVFKRHYAQAVPCGPSRACLYTGMYLQNHRSLLNGTPLDARFTNVALEARKAGYEPALFGYTDISLDPRHYDITDGYEGVLPGIEPVVHLNSVFDPWLAQLKEKGYEVPTDDPINIFRPQEGYPGADRKGSTFAPAVYRAEDSNSAFLVDETIEYLSTREVAPWFVHLSFLSPHPPFITPEPYHDMYNADETPLPIRHSTPEEEGAQHPWLKHVINNQVGSSLSVDSELTDRTNMSDQELRQAKATYYGMMSEVDDQIGRLLAYLKRTNAYNDTLIIFTSDHGDNMGDHWAFSKYTYFEHTFHIPLIIRDPSSAANQTRGTTVDAFTESVDLMPSILDAIGVDIPTQCDGRSLLPFCQGNVGEHPQGWRQEYHAELDLRSPYGVWEAPPLGLKMKHSMLNIIRGERFKYVHFTALPPLFFDLENDPDEFNNLADVPVYQKEMLEYAGKMLSWRMEHDDPALTDLHLTRYEIVDGLRN